MIVFSVFKIAFVVFKIVFVVFFIIVLYEVNQVLELRLKFILEHLKFVAALFECAYRDMPFRIIKYALAALALSFLRGQFYEGWGEALHGLFWHIRYRRC